MKESLSIDCLPLDSTSLLVSLDHCIHSFIHSKCHSHSVCVCVCSFTKANNTAVLMQISSCGAPHHFFHVLVLVMCVFFCPGQDRTGLNCQRKMHALNMAHLHKSALKGEKRANLIVNRASLPLTLLIR